MTDLDERSYNHAVDYYNLPGAAPLPFRSVPAEMRVGDMQTWQVDLSRLPANIPVTGTTTEGSTSVTDVSSVEGLVVGQLITGVGIPTGTTIAAISEDGDLTLSAAATASGTGQLAVPYTYTLSYVFSGVVNGAPVRFSFNSGDIVDIVNLFSVTAASAETKAWIPGYYLWICYVVDQNGNRTQIAQGRTKLLPDVAGAASPIDPRSQNEKNLWALDQLIAGKTVADVHLYEISGRRIEKMSVADLLHFRGIVWAWVKRERKARGEYVRPSTGGICFGGELNG